LRSSKQKVEGAHNRKREKRDMELEEQREIVPGEDLQKRGKVESLALALAPTPKKFPQARLWGDVRLAANNAGWVIRFMVASEPVVVDGQTFIPIDMLYIGIPRQTERVLEELPIDASAESSTFVATGPSTIFAPIKSPYLQGRSPDSEKCAHYLSDLSDESTSAGLADDTANHQMTCYAQDDASLYDAWMMMRAVCQDKASLLKVQELIGNYQQYLSVLFPKSFAPRPSPDLFFGEPSISIVN
jgi:hypothetical protein